MRPAVESEKEAATKQMKIFIENKYFNDIIIGERERLAGWRVA